MINVTTDGTAEASPEQITSTIIAALRFGAAIEKAEELGLTEVAELLALLAVVPMFEPKALDVFTVLTGADA
jgi:hypothetical protein